MGICDVGVAVFEKLGVEGSAADGSYGIVVPGFHLGGFIQIGVEFVKVNFLVHIGVELMCRVEALG